MFVSYSFWEAVLSRKRSLLRLCLFGVFVLVLLLSVGSYRFFLDDKINQLAWNESELLSRSANVFSREMGHVKRVTLLLKNSIKARLISQNEYGEDVEWQNQVAGEFWQFARTSDLISQVRWVTAEGKELIRINSHDGVITRVPDHQLQDKSDRNYVKEAPSGDEVYISALDLNIENQEIIRPFQPTVRGVVRVDERVSGILVVNYDLSRLFTLMRTFSNDNVVIEVLDSKGNWLLSEDKTLEWSGILRPDDSNATIATHYPRLWDKVRASSGLDRYFDYDQLWSFLTLPIDDLDMRIEPSTLYFVAHSSPEGFAVWKRNLLFFIFLGASGVFAFLSWLVWGQVTAQFETYRLLRSVQHEKLLAEQANRKLSFSNKRLVDLQDELVESSKLSSLGLMMAGLAHEMHTPLGGVRMALSSSRVLLDREMNLNPSEGLDKLNDALTIANKNLTRALDVVSSFKRIVSNRTVKDIQPFFFHTVLNDILFSYQSVLKDRKEIRLITECPQDIEMLGYPGAMSQIIQNLFDNALEYAFQPLANGNISIVAYKEKENLILSFEDNGNGISPDILNTVFEPFITTGRKIHHSGLGLYLVNQWVYQLMKGHIDITSELGVGTKFLITIPLKQSLEDAEM